MSCRTLGRRKCAEVSPKRAVLYTRATKSIWVSLPKSPLHPYVILPYTHGQQKWTEVSPESVVLHPRATKMRGSVTQACRILLLGDENARKCHPSVPYFTLGRRKVWVSLPKSPIHPYVILPCTFRQRKWAEVSPESVVLHSRATKMLGSVTQACRAALSGDDIGLKCCLRWGVGSHRSTSPLGRAVELHRWDTPWNGTGASTLCGYTGYTILRAVKRRR